MRLFSQKLRKTGLGSLPLHGILVLICAWSLLPILWIVVSAFKPLEQLYRYPPRWIPQQLYLENFTSVMAQTDIPQHMLNSLSISGATAFLVVGMGALAAYGFARMHFRLRLTLFLLILATQMIPTLTNIIPVYLIVQKLGLIDTRTSLVIVYTAMNLPLAIWILAGFFRSIPQEIEEAAFIDGCGRFSAFWRVMLPLSLPGLAAIFILTFVIAWNEFVFALTFISSKGLRTYQVGLYDYLVTQAGYFKKYGVLNAAAVLGLIPTFIGYMLTQRYFIQGITRGAVKG